jgi:hypothetical protein
MQFFLTLHRKKLSFELFCWTAGLLYLALIYPAAEHPSLCLLKNLGIAFCPGCGLGASISYLLRGEIALSFSTHPLGSFATIVLAHRIIVLLRP